MNATFKQLFIYITLYWTVSGLSNCNSPKVNCELKSIRTLFITFGKRDGADTSYSHYILLKEFSKKCIDSATILAIVQKYCDTVSIGKPVRLVNLFNSTKNFIPGEVAQIGDLINRDCLVKIFLNEAKYPETFIFYDDKGQVMQETSTWLKDSL